MESAQSWLRCFDAVLRRGDVDAAVDMFAEEECFWRDFISFTWNIETAESRDEIRAMLHATLLHTKPCSWEILGDVETGPANMNLIQCFVRFETERGRGKGILKLKGDKCWCLLTTLQELKGFEENNPPAGENVGALLGAVKSRKIWPGGKAIQELQELGKMKQPYCLIVGGGQGGIVLGARLHRLGVPTIIVEKNKRPGDSWRNRYKSLQVHTPVWYDHLPYLPFPDDWPEFACKEDLGDWLEAYTEAMELVYWASTECKAARYDKAEQKWEVTVVRNEEEIVLYPTHLVLATGMSGVPDIPVFPGARERFKGAQCHSSQFDRGDTWVGKQCVVIGSNNSAQDICADLCESGAASVTMVQRSATHIFPLQNFIEMLSPVFNVKGRSPSEADLIIASNPYKLLPRIYRQVAERVAKENEELYKGLEEVGFLHTFGEDGTGMIPMYLRRGSGYYIDVGATRLVMEGKIKLKSGVRVEAVTEKSMLLSDGSELAADLIVYATGYAPMQRWAASLISQQVADTVGPCWGLGSGTTKDPGPWERELRNMWKPTRQQNLWFQGGGFHEARHCSIYLALQLKARLEHIPTPIFRFPAPSQA